MQATMVKDRLILGIGRLENALSRVERSVARLRQQPPIPPRDDAAMAALAGRHKALRARVEQTIDRIDRLIAAEED